MKTPAYMIKIKGYLNHFNFRRIEECSTVLRWLNPLPGERILDVGCGDGYYDWLIAKSGAVVAGVDVHDKRLAHARRFHAGQRTEFHDMNAEEMDFPDAHFDKAVSLCVMEHLNNDQQVMRHISRVLKAEGSFVFSADSLSASGLTPEERLIHQERYAVNSFYTLENIKDKLSQTGFDIEEARYILKSPSELFLIRLSWKLDNLPKIFTPFRWLGYFILGTAWKIGRHQNRDNDAPGTGGMTLLIRAKKRTMDLGSSLA